MKYTNRYNIFETTVLWVTVKYGIGVVRKAQEINKSNFPIKYIQFKILKLII